MTKLMLFYIILLCYLKLYILRFLNIPYSIIIFFISLSNFNPLRYQMKDIQKRNLYITIESRWKSSISKTNVHFWLFERSFKWNQRQLFSYVSNAIKKYINVNINDVSKHLLEKSFEKLKKHRETKVCQPNKSLD